MENETLTWRANPAAGSAIRFGASVLAENRHTANAATVYYGGNPWRVIGYNGAGAAGQSGYMTLLAAANMGTSKFDANGNTRKKYKDSTLKNAIDDIAYAHTVAERIAMERRDLAAGSYAGADTDCVEGSTVYSCLCWPLSTKEANAVDGALLNDGEAWWLRSPGDGDNNVGYVTHYGLVDEIGVSYLRENGVRPAFYVDLDSIAFASPAAGGKQGDGALNLKDAVLIRRFLAGGWDVTIDTAAADVDKNVALQNVVLIERFLTGGWNVILE